MPAYVRTLAPGRGWIFVCVSTSFFAAFTVLGAKVAIPLWFTPVPITLQVMAALLAGLLLGPRLGALSQLQYLALGLSGLPVFAAGKAGPAAFMGPTGGYLIGLVALAFVAGMIYERLGRAGRLRAVLACLPGVLALYACGFAWLFFWLGPFGGHDLVTSLAKTFALGVAPFVAVDLAKAVMVAFALESGKGFIARLR